MGLPGYMKHAKNAFLKIQSFGRFWPADYNVPCQTDMDVYKPGALGSMMPCFEPEVRKAYVDLLKQGWTDALRTLQPQRARIYTFWDYFRNAYARNAGLRK